MEHSHFCDILSFEKKNRNKNNLIIKTCLVFLATHCKASLFWRRTEQLSGDKHCKGCRIMETH